MSLSEYLGFLVPHNLNVIKTTDNVSFYIILHGKKYSKESKNI